MTSPDPRPLTPDQSLSDAMALLRDLSIDIDMIRGWVAPGDVADRMLARAARRISEANLPSDGDLHDLLAAARPVAAAVTPNEPRALHPESPAAVDHLQDAAALLAELLADPEAARAVAAALIPRVADDGLRVYEYDAEYGWIVESDGEGASRIVAKDVLPSFGRWAERAAPAGDPWAELRAEVEATNRWYDGDKPVNSVSAWVGFWPPTGWYGGAGFDGDCMEEVAEASGATAGEAATMLVRLMREWRDRTDRERAEEDDPA